MSATEVDSSAGRDMLNIPKLSVVVLNYNYGRYLHECLAPILEQTMPDFELIIIDDCSSDNSLKILAQYELDERVRMVIHSVNIGFVDSLIEGTNACRANLFTVISADDVVRQKDFFERVIKIMLTREDVAFCASGFDRFDDSGTFEQTVSFDRDTIIESREAFERYMTTQTLPVIHSGVVINRKFYDLAGGYNPSIAAAVDVTMWAKLCALGGVGYVASDAIGWRQHSGQMTAHPGRLLRDARDVFTGFSEACDLAQANGLPGHSLRRPALQQAILRQAVVEAFGSSQRLALLRSLAALRLHPQLSFTARDFWVVILRVTLGRRGFAALRSFKRIGSLSGGLS